MVCAHLEAAEKEQKFLKLQKDRESSEKPHMLSWNFLEREDLSVVCADLHKHQVKVTKVREVIENGTKDWNFKRPSSDLSSPNRNYP